MSEAVESGGERPVLDAHDQVVAHAGEPPGQLRAFATVRLAPGASAQARLPISRSGFEAWLHGRFATVPGTYRISVGPNAEHLAISLATPAP